ncbi:uncharacterized protein LOC111717389 [Eurytemora carolleeae]|uniref:uncharacterized protein LOC111717389 n=1 Tax=Eurytemora carolleeae TaxID=1294199 RepID=UPI000C791C73|nr:uncharacterized protein LOC111717389 [Eurytemora carolleeae]XP_023348656.1 uncharacterized protein LOC111717389 [Eurytemora carolleeae]|eukprot:XP_023348655.1 uncharacterized protein LOC111717389 [Eurytemora affinis]
MLKSAVSHQLHQIVATVFLVSYSYCIPVLVNETSQDYLTIPETGSLPSLSLDKETKPETGSLTPLSLDNQTKPETGSLPSFSLGPSSTLYSTAIIETSLEPPRMYSPVNESDMDINRPLDDTNTSGEHPLNNNDNSDTTQNLNGFSTQSWRIEVFLQKPPTL